MDSNTVLNNLKNIIEFDDGFETKLKQINDYDSKLEQIDKVFVYGTSGFRYDEIILDKV